MTARAYHCDHTKRRNHRETKLSKRRAGRTILPDTITGAKNRHEPTITGKTKDHRDSLLLLHYWKANLVHHMFLTTLQVKITIAIYQIREPLLLVLVHSKQN
jgi:hypothetical protein